MAGVKASKGQKTNHTRYYARGQEWRPCKVVQKKRHGNGTRQFMAAKSVQTGETYKNSHGNTAPWHSIQFSPVKPQGQE
jgi:hypothetical protein